jgi:hypothetical protein
MYYRSQTGALPISQEKDVFGAIIFIISEMTVFIVKFMGD